MYTLAKNNKEKCVMDSSHGNAQFLFDDQVYFCVDCALEEVELHMKDLKDLRDLIIAVKRKDPRLNKILDDDCIYLINLVIQFEAS